jgi:hypothetical protein
LVNTRIGLDHLTIWQHTREWFAACVDPRITVMELAAELVRQSAAGTFEFPQGKEPTPRHGFSYAVDREASRVMVAFTFDLDGGPVASDEIRRKIEALDSTLAASKAIRLSREGLDRWRLSPRGLTWAQERGLDCSPVGQLPATPPGQRDASAEQAQAVGSAPSKASAQKGHDPLTPEQVRKWFRDLAQANPAGMSHEAMARAYRAEHGTLSNKNREVLRNERSSSRTPDAWRTAGPKGRNDKDA